VIATHIEHHRRVVNLQQRLWIFGLSPIDNPRRGHFAQIGQISFRALERIFLTMACAAGAGMLQASSLRSGALNTSSGEPNSFNKRADSRAAIPGVKVNAIHDSDESSSIERPSPVEPMRQVTLLSSQFARILAINGQVAAVMALPAMISSRPGAPARNHLKRRVFGQGHIFAARKKIGVDGL